MASRIKLHNLLKTLLGSSNVYFQPSSNLEMAYPCIVYGLNAGSTKFADNTPYHFMRRYGVTIIDEDPDSPIVDKVATLPMCTFDRAYKANNLNHTNYNIYY